MNLSREAWEAKRDKGLARYLMVDGVLYTGGPFAVVLQVAGYFLFAMSEQTFGQYFASATTWLTFMLHGTLFGGIMGFIRWRRYERAYPPKVAEA